MFVLLKGNKNVMRPDCPVEKLTCAHMYERYIWDRKILKKSQFYIVKKIQFKKKANTYISEEFQKRSNFCFQLNRFIFKEGYVSKQLGKLNSITFFVSNLIFCKGWPIVSLDNSDSDNDEIGCQLSDNSKYDDKIRFRQKFEFD